MLDKITEDAPGDDGHTGETTQSPGAQAEFWAGVRATFPLVVGATPFAVIFGALAINSGISASGASLMSALVFAGSAQFIATGLVANGAAPIIIILTTLVVNLRHALYAASLAPYLKHLPQGWLALLGFWLTDESYAVVIDHYQHDQRLEHAERAPTHTNSPHRHWFFFGSALFMYINWQVWTYVGVRAGGSIADPRSWGLDFALSVTFIGLLIPMLRDKAIVTAVVVAGASAVPFYQLPNQFGLILAAVFGVASGMLVGWLGNGRRSSASPN
jgi:4-azaleucine resistance transporter AzlC